MRNCGKLYIIVGPENSFVLLNITSQIIQTQLGKKQ